MDWIKNASINFEDWRVHTAIENGSGFLYGLEQICKDNDLSPEDMVLLDYSHIAHKDKYIKRIKNLSIRIESNTAGLVLMPPLAGVLNTSHGHAGLTYCEIAVDQLRIGFWEFHSQFTLAWLGYDLLLIKKSDLFSFYRALLKIEREAQPEVVPVLPKGVAEDIYENTIGFLTGYSKNRAAYERFRIPYKRGILLSGKPGCGKTMTCKWLRSLCMQNGFEHQIITLSMYQQAMVRGTVSELFKLRRRGIVFFDDMDVMLKSRDSGNIEISNFLSILDGIIPTEGAVFVFTTNYTKQELDSAIVRPGRIDMTVQFQLPDASLRRKFVDSFFEDEIKQSICVDTLTENTNEMSFADLEEIRKLFCHRIMAQQPADLNAVLSTYKRHRKEYSGPSIGFAETRPEFDDNFYAN